jgi:hypothetical protein
MATVAPVQVTLNELRRNIPIFGPHVTPLIVSEPGCGKSSLLYQLAADLGDKYSPPIYFDAPSTDYGDIGQRIPNRDTKALEFMVAEELNLDDPRPKLIMIDEFLKCGKMMRIIFTRLILDRVVGNRKLHPDSIVIANSNNASDGIGDFAQAHEGNRVCFYEMAKPRSADDQGKPIEWTLWAAANGVSPMTCAFAVMNPIVFASYKNGGQDNNPYIFNPKTNNKSFLSPRSLAKMDMAFIQHREVLGREFTFASMVGTIGRPAAELYSAFMELNNEVPAPAEVFKSPLTALLSPKLAAQYVTLFQLPNAIKTQDDLTASLTYVERLNNREIYSLFYTLLTINPTTAGLAMGNAKLSNWLRNNHFMVI